MTRAEAKTWFAKVAGVTHPNPDGVPRQDIIARCSIGDRIAILHEVDNPVSDTAVAVIWCKTGWFGRVSYHQIGYLPGGTSTTAVFNHLKRGGKIDAEITDLTGGTRDKPTLGVNLKITQHPIV